MQTVEKTEYPALKRLGSQIGYGIAIGLSLLLIFIVQNLEDWDLLPFLTAEFGDVVPWITFSLLAGALAYLVYILYDSQTLRWAGEIVTNVITIVVTWRVFTVFPFDFTAYEFPWDVLARFVMVVAIVGASIGVVVNAVKLIRSAEA
jgi:hypothetical protein